MLSTFRYCLRDREIRHLVVWNTVGLAFGCALFCMAKGPIGLLLAPLALVLDWGLMWFLAKRATGT